MSSCSASVTHQSDRWLSNDGARLRYRSDGAGPAVLLVHGWTLDLDMWEPQARALAGALRIIRYDRRGFGLSSGTPAIDRDAADILAVLDHLSVPRVVLLGMSQGARPALAFAASHPQRVAGLVLDGPPSVDPAQAAERAAELPYEHYRALAQSQGLDAFRREWLQHPLTRLHTTDSAIRALLAVIIARYPGLDLRAAAPGTPVSARADDSVVLADLRTPTLVISGRLDLPTRRRWAVEIMSKIPLARHVEISDAGHLTNLDNPAEHSRCLREFVLQHAPF